MNNISAGLDNLQAGGKVNSGNKISIYKNDFLVSFIKISLLKQE
jgi:hypothetical protein